MTNPILFEKLEHILVITLNRPEVRNALNKELLNKLSMQLLTLAQDRDVRVVVFRGAGDKAFSAGADLKERKDLSLADTRDFVKLIRRTFDQIAGLAMPTIAAIDGFAFGGGLELALACDFRVMHDKTQVGLTECALGIIPGAGGTQRLPRIIGISGAKKLIFTADRISGQTAQEIGLADEVVSEGCSAFDRAMEVAGRICKNAPLSVMAAKRAIDQGYGLPIEEGLKHEAFGYETILLTQDRKEGLRAFEEKRAPSYLGR